MKIYSDISLIDASSSISAGQNIYVLVRGNDGVVRQAPLTVNSVPMSANGNIAANLTATVTGLSSSLSSSFPFISPSFTPRPPVSGTLFVVSGETDPATVSKNGEAYIFVTSSAQTGQWQQIFGFNFVAADARYVRLTSTSSQSISSSLNITGSILITGSSTFSGSIFISGATNLGGAVNNVLVLGTDGKLYITGAYGSGGGSGTPGSPVNSIQYNSSNAFAGSSSFTFDGSTVNLTGSLLISGSTPLRIIGGTSTVTGSFIVSSSTNLIGTTNVTGSLIVSSSSNVIGTSRVTGSLIVSNSLSVVGTGSISGSLTISSSSPGQTVLQITGTGSATTAPIVQIAGQTGGFVQVYDFNSGSLFSVNNNTGTAIIDVRSNGQTLIGSNAYQGMYDSTGYALMPAPGQTLTIPGYLTSSYNALWFEYFTTSGSYSRAGLFHTSWSGSSIIYTDITSSFLGSVPTNNISFTASFSSSYVQLIASASTNGWLIKGSIRGI